MSPATAIRDIVAGAGRWLAVGGEGSGSVFSSTDKATWVEMPFGFGECKAAIFSAGKFYVAVDGEGIYALDADVWTLVQASAQVFTNGVDANGVPIFATTDGDLWVGPTWTSKKVSSGKLKVAYNAKLFVASLVGETLETLVGTTAQNLVSEGTSTLDGLDIFSFFVDANGVVVGTCKMNVDEPLIMVRRNNKWTFVFSDMPVPLTHVVNKAVAGGPTIYTTSNYFDYTEYYSVDKDITALLYA
jgi:hypothetical protein